MHQLSNSNAAVGEIVEACNSIEVCWLPSLPLISKHKAPPISGLGILYSEELDRVLQVFDTDNLREGVKGFSRDQAAALNIDPDCRLYWLEVSNPIRRAQSKLELQTQMLEGRASLAS